MLNHPPRAILFDLDGTLLDTAPDLHRALMQLSKRYHLKECTLSTMRSLANLGSKALIKQFFEVEPSTEMIDQLRKEFFTYYENAIAHTTQFFPQIEEVLAHLEAKDIPWGIVTNKLTKHTHELLNALGVIHRPHCIVCGDTLPTAKPDPAPIRYACELLQQSPADCIYIGDAITDVIASKAAGTQSLVALYGYIHTEDNPLDWQADGYIQEPIEILTWIEACPSNRSS